MHQSHAILIGSHNIIIHQISVAAAGTTAVQQVQ